MRKINSGTVKIFITALLAPALGMILAGNVMAQSWTDLNFNVNGVDIHADTDGAQPGVESIRLIVGNTASPALEVFSNRVDVNVPLTNNGDVTVLVDNDNGGYGSFIVQDSNGTADTVTIINADAQSTTLSSLATSVSGTLGVTGASTLHGINNSGSGISSVGSIAGATTITASSDITGEDLIATDEIYVNPGTGNVFHVDYLGNTAMSGTLGVTGASTLHGIDNSGSGVSNVGTITGASSITGGELSLNTVANTTINVNTDGIAANESFVVNVGGSGGGSVPSTINTIRSNENSTVLTNGAAALTVGGASQANTISLNSTSNTLTAATSNSMAVTGGSAVTTTATQVKALTAAGQGLTVTNGGAVSLMGGGGSNTAGLNVDAAGDTVSLLNNVNGGHGLTIDAAVTTLTGGTHSSSLTLQDASATLAVGTASSGEVQVINATNVGGITSVAIGGTNNSSNLLQANATTGTNNVEAKNNNMGVATANSINTIGNAGTSTNTITGLNNNMTASNDNTITASNDNTIIATAGSNTMTANAANQSNTLSADGTSGVNTLSADGTTGKNYITATGTNGVNYLTANATTGTNNVEAKNNNMGVATANSINTIGNAGTSTNTITGSDNSMTATVSNTLTAPLNTIGDKTTYEESSDAIKVEDGSGVSIKSVVDEYGNGGDISLNAERNTISAGTANIIQSDHTNTISAADLNTITSDGDNIVDAANANTITSGFSNTLSSKLNVIGNGIDYGDSTDAIRVTGGTGVDIKGITANTMTSGVSNTLNSALNVIGNDETYGAATDAIRVTGGAGVDIKGTTANTMTSGVSNTLNSALNVIGNNGTYGAATDAIQVTGGTGVAVKGKDVTISAAAVCVGDSCSGGSNTLNADQDNNITADLDNYIVSEQGDNSIRAENGANVMIASLGTPNPGPGNASYAGYKSKAEYNTGENSILADVANRIYAPLTVIGSSEDSDAQLRVVNNAEGGGTINASVMGAVSILEGGEDTASAMTLINAGETGSHAEIGATGGITIVAGEAGEASASLTLTNGIGNTHGIVVAENATVISGGAHSTSLTFADNGATFQNSYGAPVKVTGVADGKSDYDAVNFKQLKQAFSGIASVAAMAAIPEPAKGDNFALGMGYGNFKGANAMAVGLKGRIGDNITMSAGMGYGSSDIIVPNAGFSFSW